MANEVWQILASTLTSELLLKIFFCYAITLFPMRTPAEPAQGQQTQRYYFHKLRQSLGQVLTDIYSCHLSAD